MSVGLQECTRIGLYGLVVEQSVDQDTFWRRKGRKGERRRKGGKEARQRREEERKCGREGKRKRRRDERKREERTRGRVKVSNTGWGEGRKRGR